MANILKIIKFIYYKISSTSRSPGLQDSRSPGLQDSRSPGSWKNWNFLIKYNGIQLGDEWSWGAEEAVQEADVDVQGQLKQIILRWETKFLKLSTNLMVAVWMSMVLFQSSLARLLKLLLVKFFTPEGLRSIFWRLMDLKQIIMIKDSNLKKICHSVKKLFLWSRRCQLKKAYISKKFKNRRN